MHMDGAVFSRRCIGFRSRLKAISVFGNVYVLMGMGAYIYSTVKIHGLSKNDTNRLSEHKDNSVIMQGNC
jgi:hypothetical protein